MIYLTTLALVVACSSAGVPKGFFAKTIDQQKAEFAQYDFDRL